MLYLKQKQITKQVISLDNSKIKKRKNDDYEYYGRCDDLENYFHSLFFEKLYNNLTNNFIQNKTIETYNGFELFVEKLLLSADGIAYKIKNCMPIDIDYLLALWNDFDESHINNEVRFQYKYRVSQITITNIIFDLVIILGLGDLCIEDLKKLLNFKHFRDEFWFQDYINNNVLYLSKDAAKYYLNYKFDKLKYNLQYTQERTDEYLNMSLFALIHNLTNEAKMYLDNAFKMALGYCHHKDPILYQVLESLEYCIDGKIFNCEKLILKIARIIEILDAITDSHSDHAKKILMRLLYKVNPSYCAKYYHHLLFNEEWHCAKEAYNELIKNINSLDENLKLLISTIADDISALNPIIDLDIVEEKKRLLGIEEDTKKQETFSKTNDIQKMQSKKIEVKRFPINKLREFIKQLDFLNEKYLLEWISYWSDHGDRKKLLDEFELVYSENLLTTNSDIYLDKLFEITLSFEGKDSAYKWLVRSVIQNVSWADYHSSWQKTKERFNNFKTYYLDRWKDFIIDTSENKYSCNTKEDFVIGTNHLVYFLVFIGENDLAKELMIKLVDLLEEDMADMPIREITWL